MHEGVGLGLAGPSFFAAYFSQGGAVGHRPPGSGEAVAFSFAGYELGYAQSCRLEHGALWNDALRDIAPQRDEELASQRHDGDAAYPPLPGAGTRLEPPAQG